MNFRPSVSMASMAAVSLVCVALSASNDAHAVAQIGGSIGLTIGPGLGACNASAQVPTTTRQDSFRLSAATPLSPVCGGQSASGSMHAEAATRSLGMQLTASGPLTTAAGQVALADTWFITPPPGTPTGLITMPVSFSLDGSVAPGSIFRYGRFLDYVFIMADPNSGAGSPLQRFNASGQISATGNVTFVFNGLMNIRNMNQSSFPMSASILMQLFVPQLDSGSIDFYNTAVASIVLPPGFTATTSSGMPLVFAPVPEPATFVLWALGLAAVGVAAGRRLAPSTQQPDGPIDASQLAFTSQPGMGCCPASWRSPTRSISTAAKPAA